MKNFKTKKIIIKKSQSNSRIDQALTQQINEYSRTQIKLLLQNKNVRNDKKIITEASYKVKKDEVYYITLPEKKDSQYEPQNISLNILFEDQDLIVLNKPAGMVTHPGPGNQKNTLVNALLYHTNKNLSLINKNQRPGIVHRLDKDTSGLIVIAKNDQSHLHLSKQFKEHTISRKYISVVWGIPTIKNINGFINRHKINRKKMSLNQIGKGKYSETNIKVLKSYEICSLVECKLKTGRTHQIRVHMHSIKHPLVGDKVYGNIKNKSFRKNNKYCNKFAILKNFHRQALHASTIGFVHPTTKKNLKFKSDLPNDMLNLLEFLLKY